MNFPVEDLLQMQELLVKPMVEAVHTKLDEQLKPIADSQKTLEELVRGFDSRIKRLEGSQAKALLGWGAYATLVSVAVAAAWKYITSKIHFG